MLGKDGFDGRIIFELFATGSCTPSILLALLWQIFKAEPALTMSQASSPPTIVSASESRTVASGAASQTPLAMKR